MNAIYCPECGAGNPIENTVCEKCGADLSAVKSVIDNANAHYNEALALAHNGRLDEAIAQLEAALALSSQNPQFHNLMGTLYAQKGLFSEAIRAWERTLELDPEAEKAYNNIEKARDMEEEFAEEADRRPYVLTAYVAGALAFLMFCGACFVTYRLMTKNRMIDNFIAQERQYEQKLAALQQEGREWEMKYAAVTEHFPQGGVTAMLQEFTKLQTEVETRERMIEQLRERIQRQNESSQAQVAALNQEKAALQNQVQELNALQAQNRSLSSQIEQLNNQLNQLRQQLEQTQNQLAQTRQNVESEQQTVRNLRNQHAAELQNLRSEYDANLSSLRDQNLQLRDDIARYERQLEDRNYADTLLVEALRSLDENRFELAHQSVHSAMDRAPRNAAAAFLLAKVEGILNDPIEQEMLRFEAQQRAQQRQEQRILRAGELMREANDLFRNGRFDDAIEKAQLAKSMNNSDERFVRDCNRLISQAQEIRLEISLQISEVRRNLQNNDVTAARRALDNILRRAPHNTEAQELLAQITQ